MGKGAVMTKELTYIFKKYGGVWPNKLPIEIPNTDRVELTKLFAELGYKVGVEVGVEQGLYSETILENNPGSSLFLVDPWLAYPGYREHVSQEKLDGFLEITKNRLQGHDFRVVRKPSIEAAKDFPDNSIDFVYIDGNHEFSYVVADICAWYPKVRSGGIVAGHDFISRRDPKLNMHVPEAVRGFTSAYQINPWFILGRKDKRPGELRDNTRSWFFVKE